jgi:hypothetical protein
MVCVAAFIILAIMGVFVAILSIFKRDIGKRYWKIFKKAWGCVGKKVRLQKCETGFKEDVKNTIMSRVIIKHPTWVKPLSVVIEVVSVIIVVVAVWSILTAIKSLLALWALGTCNVTTPSACTLGAEVCSIDESEPQNIFESTGRWFTEWGEIFAAVPDKFRDYSADNFDLSYITTNNDDTLPVVVDIVDPGCIVCKRSYTSQKHASYFESNQVRLVPFVIMTPDGTPKFKNSEIIVRYLYATSEKSSDIAIKVLERIFLENDTEGATYQNRFNEDYSAEVAEATLTSWLKEFGLTTEDIDTIKTRAHSEDITNLINKNRRIVEDEIHVRGIPTTLENGTKQTGLWQAK